MYHGRSGEQRSTRSIKVHHDGDSGPSLVRMPFDGHMKRVVWCYGERMGRWGRGGGGGERTGEAVDIELSDGRRRGHGDYGRGVFGRLPGGEPAEVCLAADKVCSCRRCMARQRVTAAGYTLWSGASAAGERDGCECDGEAGEAEWASKIS